MNMPILSFLILLPLLGATTIAFIGDAQSPRNTPRVALLTTGIHLFLSLFLWYHFDPFITGPQYIEMYPWLPSLNCSYHLGVDGLSLFFIVLTSFLTLLIFIHPFQVGRLREYYSCFLLLESFLMGVFCSLDLVLFYFFFEAVLIPMFLIIGIWGGVRRIYATFKFFLFTLIGSVLMLVAFVVMYYDAGTTNMLTLNNASFSFEAQRLLWLCLFAAFAVKIPMWPVHTWLPDAHVEAPTGGSMILAGILLKLGGYGMLRLLLPILPDASHYFAPLVYALSIIAIIYTSLVALVQKDMKKLVAYSSIAHMGFVTLGIFTVSIFGIVGSIVQMVSHGLVSAALFFCVGVVYERFHTREIAHYGGLVTKMPRYAVLFMLFTLASIGLPGTSGFIGEFLVTFAVFKVSPTLAAFTVVGVVLSAAYGLWLYRRIVYDKLNTAHLDIKHMVDLRFSETVVLVVLIIPVFVIGLYPKPLTSILNPYAQKLMDTVHKRTVIKHTLMDTLINSRKLGGEKE
jgi:NADH-quinone oxidoreductase subunit M